MKAFRVVHILLALFLICSCRREESILYDYRILARELKVNSSEYTEEDWNNVARKYKQLEKKATKCDFSQREKKELNRLRLQCVAYMHKGKTSDSNSMTTSEGVAVSLYSEETVNSESLIESNEDGTGRGDALLEIPISTMSINKQILYRKGYTASYNNKTLCPNWVAWKLTKDHTDGSYPKTGIPYYSDDGSVTPETLKNNYFVDLEAEKPRQEHSDWLERPSDIDHGHMCPAGDNKWDKAAMNQSYLLTNMCPQNSSLNSGGWNKLEEKCRKWANSYGDIYIVAGPIFYDGVKNTFGANKIAIPDAFFKVVLCMSGKPKAIGFIYENNSSSQSMYKNSCTINHVEVITGFDFFSSLPDDIEDIIEAKSNINDWK